VADVDGAGGFSSVTFFGAGFWAGGFFWVLVFGF
jgi:hypothetical protein